MLQISSLQSLAVIANLSRRVMTDEGTSDQIGNLFRRGLCPNPRERMKISRNFGEYAHESAFLLVPTITRRDMPKLAERLGLVGSLGGMNFGPGVVRKPYLIRRFFFDLGDLAGMSAEKKEKARPEGTRGLHLFEILLLAAQFPCIFPDLMVAAADAKFVRGGIAFIPVVFQPPGAKKLHVDVLRYDHTSKHTVFPVCHGVGDVVVAD